MSRADARSVFTHDQRVVLLEGDMDNIDHLFELIGKRLDAADARLDKIIMLMVGLLISTTTGAILFAVNLIAGH